MSSKTPYMGNTYVTFYGNIIIHFFFPFQHCLYLFFASLFFLPLFIPVFPLLSQLNEAKHILSALQIMQMIIVITLKASCHHGSA